MKKMYLIALLCCAIAHAQEKTNPILFLDGSAGYAVGKIEGPMFNIGLHYQHKNDLFTLRYQYVSGDDIGILAPYPFYELFRIDEEINEYAVLYGKRYVYDNNALSFSLGAGYLDHKVASADNSRGYDHEGNIGLPFEVNFKWFKREKAPYRIYGVIPVGGKTSFGNSFGFKLSGAVSKTSYIGIGLCFGIGYHKEY